MPVRSLISSGVALCLAVGAFFLVRIECAASHNSIVDIAIGVTVFRNACILILPVVTYGIFTGIRDFRTHAGSRIQNGLGIFSSLLFLAGTLYLLRILLTYPL